MKKKWLYYLVVVLIILVAVGTVGLLVYDLTVKKDTSSIPRAVAILASITLALIKLLSGGRGNTRATYESAYAGIIGNAFKEGNRSKQFYSALDKRNSGRYKSVLAILNKLFEGTSDREERFVSAFFIAICYDDMEAYVPAIKWYERAIEYKRHSTALSNLGICYKRMGDLDRATLAYEEASMLDPSNPNPYINLANIYLASERYDIALEFADKAIALNPSIAAAYSARAIACAMLGDKTGYTSAVRYYALNGGDGAGIERLARSMMAPIF